MEHPPIFQFGKPSTKTTNWAPKALMCPILWAPDPLAGSEPSATSTGTMSEPEAEPRAEALEAALTGDFLGASLPAGPKYICTLW